MNELPPEGDPKQAKIERPTTEAKNDKIESLIAAMVKINQANRKADNAEHKRTDRREKTTFWLHIAEIILVSVYAFFTILEWNTFSNESKTMAAELKASQGSAEAQIHTMQSQLEEMQKTRESDQRAWVYVEIQDENLSLDGTNCMFTFQIRNAGKTSALMTGNFARTIFDSSQIPRIDDEVTGLQYMLSPGQSFPDKFAINKNTITTSAFAPVYVYGTIFYSDIYGEKHWTQFCYTITKAGTIVTASNFHGLTDDFAKIQSK